MQCCKFVFAFLALLLITQPLAEARGRGGGERRGGRRGGRGGRGKGGRGGSRSRAPTSFSSRVTSSQTTRGTRSRASTTTIHTRTRFALIAAPVYNYGYSFHGGFVVIPDDRALRIRSQSEKLRNASGEPCLPNIEANYTLIENVQNFFVQSTGIVTYGAGMESQNKTYSSDIDLDKNAVGKNVSVSCVARYNRTIVPETKCSWIHTAIEGTLVGIESEDSGDGLPWGWIGFGILCGVFILIVILIDIRKRLCW